MKDYPKQLKRYLKQLDLTVDEAQQQALLEHLVLLQKWNQTYNLTAITDFEEMLVLHLLDSLVIAPHIHGERIIDIGTGAGFPGIPLAILFPEKKWVLLDSNGKKTRFLIQVIAQLKLDNVEVVTARTETYQNEAGFDMILTRAFTSLQNMLEKTTHLCCNGGSFLAMKGTHPQAEVDECITTHSNIDVIPLNVPDLTAERHLVIIKKEV